METPQPTTAEATAQNVTISLRDIGLKYLGALQRVFDLSAFTAGALRGANEKDYEEFSKAPRFMPSQKVHLPFDEAKVYAEKWLLKSLLAETFSLVVPFLEDARSICALSAWKASGVTDQEALKRILTEDRQAFLRLSFEEKFQHLGTNYNVTTQLQVHLGALAKLGTCLASRGGTVSDADVTEEGALLVRLAVLDIQPADPTKAEAGASAETGFVTRIAELQRKFAVGQNVDLRKEEYLNAVATVALFVTGLLASVQQYVKSTQETQAS